MNDHDLLLNDVFDDMNMTSDANAFFALDQYFNEEETDANAMNDVHELGNVILDNVNESEPRNTCGSLYVCQWNLNGLFSHYEEFKRLMHFYDPIIVCLQETRLKPNSNPSLKGYEIFYSGGDNVRANGGVAILSKQGLSVSAISLNTELQAVAVKVNLNVQLTVCSLYVPPSDTLRKNQLLNLIEQLPSPFMICTDINAHNTIWGSNKTDVRGRLVEEVATVSGLNIMNDGSPTHMNVGFGTESAIDLTLCSPELHSLFEWCVASDDYGSDHYPILIRTFDEGMKLSVRPSWKIKYANWSNFQYLLIRDLDFLISCEYEDYVEKLREVAENSIPRSSGVVRGKKVPWWNAQLAEAIKLKRKYKRKFKRNRSEQNLDMFRKYRAKVRFLMRSSRKEYWKNYVESINIRTPAVEVWQKLRKLRGSSSKQSIISLKSDSSLICDPKDVANQFARQYADVSSSSNYSETFRKIKAHRESSEQFQASNEESALNITFNMCELQESLRHCKDTTPGPDQIHYQMIKNLPMEWLQKLLDFYNCFWQSGKIPDSWKISHILPILKPGKDPNDPKSYRPIALTSCIGKIMERMVNFRLCWHLNQRISMSQCGFRKYCGAEDCHVIIEEHMLNARLNNQHFLIVSLDIKSAFDMSWRHGILSKLQTLGIKGNIFNFCQDFISERRIKVLVGASVSDEYYIENGIIQGSVISPTLFRVSLYDLPDKVDQSAVVVGYADDWYIIARHNDFHETQRIMQNAVNDAVKWFDNNGYSLSISKTAILYSSSRRNFNSLQEQIRIVINDEPIKLVSHHKILGLIFDSKMTWKPHMEQIKKKASQRLSLLRSLAGTSFGSDQHTLLRIHQMLILPIINFGCPAYSSASNSTLKTLNSIHNSGMRIALGAFRTSAIEYIENEAGMEDLERQRDRRTLNLAGKILCLPSHPLYDTLAYEIEDEDIDQYKRKQNSFCMRVRLLLRSYDLSFEDVEDLEHIGIEPWARRQIKCNLELTAFNKENTIPIIIQNKFKEILSEYPDFACIYTDGSKSDTAVGYGVHSTNHEISKRLNAEKSVYSSELFAIREALILCQASNDTKFLICTDSLSAIQALKGMQSKSMVEEEIRNLYHSLTNEKDIRFFWVPSHIGIKGNERADELAKNALSSSETQFSFRSFKELKSKIRRSTQEFMLRKWEVKGGQMWDIKKTFAKFSPNLSLTRRKQVALTRVRIGHSRYTHACLFEGTRFSQCNCGETLSMFHILFHCPLYSDEREEFLLNFSYLGSSHTGNEQVLRFLEKIGILREL